MRPDPDALMIFAAGFGTRMGALTATRPKPLLTLGGRTLLDRALDTANEVDLSRIVVNAHHLADQIEAALAGQNITISREHPDILDTGGGLAHARGLLKSDIVYTLNPDVLFVGPNPLKTLERAWRVSGAKALLLLVPLANAEMRRGAGDFDIDPDGHLTRGTSLVYTGAQIIDAAGLAAVPEKAFSLNLYWDRLAETGDLAGVVYSGRWCDLGTPEALDHAEHLLSRADG